MQAALPYVHIRRRIQGRLQNAERPTGPQQVDDAVGDACGGPVATAPGKADGQGNDVLDDRAQDVGQVGE